MTFATHPALVNALQLFLFLTAVFFAPVSHAVEEPLRMRRAEAFLGIHFDFHAGKDCNRVGARTTPEMIEQVLDKVKPDYIQIDCKGHDGYSSYPTKAGNPAPGFVGDPLRVWRDVTRRRAVALFMHYSGVWDSHAVAKHPEWAAFNGDNKPNKNSTSAFGPYVDELMIPQLRELAGEYQVDGAWIDGDCWGATPDYAAATVRKFCEQTGADAAPYKSTDPYWNEWMDFHREAFRSYLRHYVDELKASHPDFQLISNWAFSDLMPEPVSADVASLSGDFAPDNSVNSARFSGRCLEDQGRPWDLMSWSFSLKGNYQKPAAQLKQEAAIILALGGGYQAYFQQDREGAIKDLSEMDVMAEVAQFCRDRQAFCHHSVAVPQIALLYSTAGHYRASPRLFHITGSHGATAVRQTLIALLENQVGVQILSEHHLQGHMSNYPAIIVPEWEYLTPDFRDELADYAKSGGQLLLIGSGPAKLFESELSAASESYANISHLEALDKTLPAIIEKVLPQPLVRVMGSNLVDVCPRKLGGKLSIHLVNTAGPHQNAPAGGIQEIPAIGPLTIKINLPQVPNSITQQPENQPLEVTWTEGTAMVTLPSLELYSILVIEL